MDIEKKIAQIFPILSNIFNSLSVLSSVIVIITYITLALYRYELVERVSLRLQVGVSLMDFFNAFFALFHHSVKSGPFCIFLGFWRSFGEEMYCFLNIAIAINLQLLFVHSFKPKKQWEIFYWLFPIIISSTLSLIPLGMDLYGLNKGNLCFIKEDSPHSSALILLNTSIIFLFTSLYLLIVSIAIIVKLIKDRNTVIALSHLRDTPKLGPREKLIRKLRKLTIRISLYPIAAIFGFSGFIVGYIYTTISGGQRNIYISLWGMCGITTKGVINLITFFLDPTIQHAVYILFKTVYASLKIKFAGTSGIDDIHHQTEANSLNSMEDLSNEQRNNTRDMIPLERFL